MYPFINISIMPVLMMMSLFTLTLSNNLMIWFLMEINNFMFIALMLLKMKNKKLIFLYFLMQILASFLLMFSIIINPMMTMYISNLFMITSLLIKLGVPPYHMWMILMAKSMNWMVLFLLLTLQKLVPLNLIYLTHMSPTMFMMIILLTMMIPSIGMMNITDLKILLTYSSINQTGWMVSLIYLKHPFWIMYMYMYMMILGSISLMLNKSKISNSFNQLTIKKSNMILPIMMMNMAGLPPYSFFMFKWTSTFLIISQSNLTFLMVCMLLNSLIMTFIYIKMMSWSLFINKFQSKLKCSQTKIKITQTMMILSSLLIPIMFM